MRINKGKSDPNEAVTIGLHALVWVLSDPDLAPRMLAVTGLETDDLRSRAEDPALLAALLGFLEAHEPNLLACAEALDVKPGELVTARMLLER